MMHGEDVAHIQRNNASNVAKITKFMFVPTEPRSLHKRGDL